jgi:hypothetical protein
VDCRPVICAKWVKKVILAVPNAPVVPLAKQALVSMVLVMSVYQANIEQVVCLLRRVLNAPEGLVKVIRVKHRVQNAVQEVMPNLTVPLFANIVVRTNINQN